jgi:hypothetical protein
MFQYLPDHRRVLDTGNNPDRSLALLTGLNVYGEYPFQTLNPSHGGVALGWCLIVVMGNGLFILTPFCLDPTV